jgi:hypothetical protein
MSQLTVTFRGAIKPAQKRRAKVVGVESVAEPQPMATRKPPLPTSPRPASRAAMNLALAYAIERAIEDGRLKDYSDAAKRLGVSRARITQVVDRVLLPVSMQETVLLRSVQRLDRSPLACTRCDAT